MMRNHRDPVGDLEYLVDVGGDVDYRFALGFDRTANAVDVAHLRRSQALGDLI